MALCRDRPRPTDALAETGTHSLHDTHRVERGVHLIANPFCTVTKSGEVSIRLTSPLLAGAEGRGLACRLGRLVEYVPLARTRPSTRRARLVANPFCTVTKSGEVSIKLTSPLLAGAEGLEPSARGFGVDVGTHQRERRRGGVAWSPRSSPQRAVLIWCYEESEVEKACRAISFSSPTTISFCLHRATGVGNEITTC